MCGGVSVDVVAGAHWLPCDVPCAPVIVCVPGATRGEEGVCRAVCAVAAPAPDGSRCCQEEKKSRVETVELSTSAKAKQVGGARGAKVR